MTTPLIVQGMHGMGDNVHQRAVVRMLLDHGGYDLWLKTPWPCLYHDLAGARLHLVEPPMTLRTQRKNAKRERDLYERQPPPRNAPATRVWYDRLAVIGAGSVVGGMIWNTLKRSPDGTDFTLPVPVAWRAKAEALIGRPDKPIMVLRPLVERREWGGCRQRNPDHAAYAALFNAIRDRFHVVSIADLVPGQEGIVGDKLDADHVFHRGELDTEAVAGLMAGAAVTFCSPGFAVPLSQAVGTPVICVFGGYESSLSFSFGARFAPTLGIDPIKPCMCFSHTHRCDKRIDLAAAHDRIETFIRMHCHAAADDFKIPA